MPRDVANNFVPTNPTAFMRIWETDCVDKNAWSSMKSIGNNNNNNNLIGLFHYVFDDIDEEEYMISKLQVLKGITEEIADQIKQDFDYIKDKIETLVINCHAGISRSPAVALALNNLYNLNLLDEDEFRCMGKFSNYNRFVYAKITKLWDHLKEK